MPEWGEANTIGDVCNRAVWLRRGKVVREGPTEGVVQAYTEDVATRTKAREARQAGQAGETGNAAA